jgi:hypothetical protein
LRSSFTELLEVFLQEHFDSLLPRLSILKLEELMNAPGKVIGKCKYNPESFHITAFSGCLNLFFHSFLRLCLLFQ